MQTKSQWRELVEAVFLEEADAALQHQGCPGMEASSWANKNISRDFGSCLTDCPGWEQGSSSVVAHGLPSPV